MDEAVWELKEKDRHVAKLQDQEKHLYSSFLEVVGDSKFKEYLVKVLKKRIKRPKQKQRKERGNRKIEKEEEMVVVVGW